MNKLVEAFTNTTYTQNGAITNKRTLDSLLDYYSSVGAMRGRDTVPLFTKAFENDVVNTMRVLFYIRDIRGGLGERKAFRDAMDYLYHRHRAMFHAVFYLIPEYGRWDDLTRYVNDATVVTFIQSKLIEDMSSENPSLLARHMPSENASNHETKAFARRWIKELGLTAREYRKMLTKLRARIGVVESKMSARKFWDIDYARVPSKAMTNYRKAFSKQDADRFVAYLESVKKGETKINSATLYPYEIYNKMKKGGDNDVLELQWQALPDYITTDENFLVMADVSGSMSGDPMAVSVSLALYSAERNKGAFKNLFMTFTTVPKLVEVTGRTLFQKMRNIENADWGGSTNLQVAFTLLLKTAIAHKVPQKDMPTKLFIISDMEFNSCVNGRNLDGIKEQYDRAGYTMPIVVFWNVNKRNPLSSPATKFDNGVFLVSGLSGSIFKAALETRATDPVDMMLDTIGAERYYPVQLAIEEYYNAPRKGE